MVSNSFFVFMAGDNNLDPEGVEDLREMVRADPPPDLNVVIQFDRSRGWPESGNGEATKRFAVENRELVEKEDIGETNCGDPAVLHEFLEWGTRAYPAQRNMVVVWNHGGGAKDEDPYRTARRKTKNPLFDPRGERKTFSARKAAAETQPGTARGIMKKASQSRLIAMDDSSRDFLDNIELRAALACPGKKFDIVGFDACLMNMMEVIYQVRDITDIVVGSEEIEPGTGWPYETILSYLKTNPDADNTALAKEIVALYGRSYADSGDAVTQSAVSTGDLARAVPALDEFAGLLVGSPDVRPALAGILSSAQRYEDSDYLDLYDFVLLCQKNLDRDEIRTSASRVLPLLDKAIIASESRGARVENSHGLSIYFPLKKPTAKVLDIYRNLDFSADCPGWLSLITAYHGPQGLRR